MNEKHGKVKKMLKAIGVELKGEEVEVAAQHDDSWELEGVDTEEVEKASEQAQQASEAWTVLREVSGRFGKKGKKVKGACTLVI